MDDFLQIFQFFIPVILQFVRETCKFYGESMCSENLRNLISTSMDFHQELKKALSDYLIKNINGKGIV